MPKDFLKKWTERLFRGVAPTNIIETQKEQSLPPATTELTKEVKEIPFFATKNNLLEEFQDAPVKVSSSKLSGYIDPNRPWSLEIEYKGFMLLGDSQEEIEDKKMEIDEGYTARFITVENFNKKYGNVEKYVHKDWEFELPYKGFMILGMSQFEVFNTKRRIDEGKTEGLFTIKEYQSRFGATYDEEEMLEDDIDFLNGKMKKPELPNKTANYAIGIDPYRLPEKTDQDTAEKTSNDERTDSTDSMEDR